MKNTMMSKLKLKFGETMEYEIKHRFKSNEELAELCENFHSESSLIFNTNMIKIALNLKEDRIAAVIVSRYPATIDDDTLNFSIQCFSYNFLQ
jgi:hypothetical protein